MKFKFPYAAISILAGRFVPCQRPDHNQPTRKCNCVD